MIMQENFIVLTKDHFKIGAKWYIPSKANGKVVLINSALGVKQKYYKDFAEFLAMQGMHVYTYDYRGIGASKISSIRKVLGGIMAWAEKDYAAMLMHIKQSHPGFEIVIVGHSIGGQIIGFTQQSYAADAFVLVASQTPYWRNFKTTSKIKLLYFWYFLLPVFTRLFNYFPAKMLGLFESLPKSVALQWARWAKSEDFIFTDHPEKRPLFKGLTQPTFAISFEDDKWAPVEAVQDLLKYYSSLHLEYIHLEPADLFERSIGHFGFFRKKFEKTLWLDTIKWIHQSLNSQKRHAS